MATYKVWLTVKDSYGNTKEVEGGTINVDLAELTPDEVSQIGEALPLEDYIKRDNLDTELEEYATDKDVEAVKQDKTIKYSNLNLRPEE